MKKINTVGIAGAGTMGSALAQKFAQEGFYVVLIDREMRFVESGLKKINDTLKEGIARKIFTAEQTQDITSRIKGSDNYSDFMKCELIIEAIYENFEAKTELFRNLDKIISADTIIATNTSSYSVTELANSVSHPERFIGVHYFYHATKNRLVEIIPGEKTSTKTTDTMKNFAALSGKDAIMCGDSYGFVVNRFFVPWLNEAARILEEGIASPGEIDAVCMKTFSIGMGPFALMNATGVPIADHSQKTLERFGKLYRTSEILKKQAESITQWKIVEVNLKDVNDNTRNMINERMLGIVFIVCSQILDEKICSAVEINRGARIGLQWRKGPIDIMKRTGVDEVKRMIRFFADKYNVAAPNSIGDKFWDMEFVRLAKIKDTAIITMSRPEDMNALNEVTMSQISKIFDDASSDSNVKRIILTGEGKAFVAGADIKFFIDNIKSNSIDKIVSFTKFGQKVFEKIDKCPKQIISIVNGLALGGGLELALCSDIILAVPKAVFAFPETGIGIYPGLGGTQRTQGRTGKALAKYLIYTGDFLNAEQAVKIGLVDAIINLENIPGIIDGTIPIPQINNEKTADEKYVSIQKYFESHSLDDILNQENVNVDSTSADITKLISKIKRKAPIALKTAEKLIDEEKGCESELEELTRIFSTSDSLLGLSSIGKPVEFRGK